MVYGYDVGQTSVVLQLRNLEKPKIMVNANPANLAAACMSPQQPIQVQYCLSLFELLRGRRFPKLRFTRSQCHASHHRWLGPRSRRDQSMSTPPRELKRQRCNNCNSYMSRALSFPTQASSKV